MQIVEEEMKTLNQDAGISEKNNSEFGPAQNNGQWLEMKQRNGMKTDSRQLVEQ